MKILALDAATEACSAALLVDDEVRERYEIAPRQHAELLLPMAQGLLVEAGLGLNALDALAFGRGPGAFTGLRVVTGLVQGLALGADLAVAPISDLAATAYRVMRRHGQQPVICVQDARMNEVYWCAYRSDAGDEPEPQLPERVSLPGAVEPPVGPAWRAAGNGWQAYPEALAPLASCLGPPLETHPHAEDIAWLARRLVVEGKTVDAAEATPSYVRDRVAVKPKG